MVEKSNTAPTKSEFGRFQLDLRAQGAYLLREWGLMIRPENIVRDATAAIAVSLVALPLSLAIADASGVAPEVGLVTAIVGGIAVALFGGCRLQVSGPAAAMTFLVFEIIENWNRIGEEEGFGANYGITMIVAATLLAGVFQLATGYFRIGRIMQFIPRPVVAGFLSGIGLTIFCTQLPKILGYDVTHDEEGGAIGLLIETVSQISKTDWRSLLIGLTAIVFMVGLPKISRRLPTPLIAVVVASLLPIVFGWETRNERVAAESEPVATAAVSETGETRESDTAASGIAILGAIPRSFPAPELPRIPWSHWNELILAAITIYFLASIESLLSASVVNAMNKDSKVDNDQELVGQGIGNIGSAFFGGIPVTGVIARSATNIQSGARSRASAIIHAFIILAMMLALGPIVGRIPIAALAGVLIAVAIRMIEHRLFRTLWHGSKPEAVVYLVTVGTIIMTDLIVGVPVGLAAAFVYVIYEVSSQVEVRPIPVESKTSSNNVEESLQGSSTTSPSSVIQLQIGGPMFFASGFHLRSLVAKLEDCRCVIFDMAGVRVFDFTAAEILEESIEDLKSRGVAVILAQPTPEVAKRLQSFTQRELAALRECPIVETMSKALEHAAISDQPVEV